MKIINDTLKNPETGKYSRKSLTAFVSFIISIVYGVVLDVFSSIFEWGFEPKEYVFYGFLGTAVGSLGLTVVDKIRNKKSTD